jgi:hypothetical protein
MAQYAVPFSYKVTEYGTYTGEAPDGEQAYRDAVDYVQDTYPDVSDIEVEEAKEI